MLSPTIINIIKDRYDNKKFLIAARSELLHLQFHVCLAGYLIAQRYGSFNREYLSEVKNFLIQYEGEDASDNIINSIESLLQADDTDFNEIVTYFRNQSSSLNLKWHSTILLDSNSVQISRLPIELQSKIYEFKTALNIYNQEVSNAREGSKLTFDSSLSDINHQRITENLLNTYSNLQEVCSRVCRKAQVIIDFKL